MWNSYNGINNSSEKDSKEAILGFLDQHLHQSFLNKFSGKQHCELLCSSTLDGKMKNSGNVSVLTQQTIINALVSLNIPYEYLNRTIAVNGQDTYLIIHSSKVGLLADLRESWTPAKSPSAPSYGSFGNK